MDAAAKNPSLSLAILLICCCRQFGTESWDIVRLTLSDIDWIHHETRFVQNKTEWNCTCLSKHR